MKLLIVTSSTKTTTACFNIHYHLLNPELIKYVEDSINSMHSQYLEPYITRPMRVVTKCRAIFMKKLLKIICIKILGSGHVTHKISH